MLLSPGVDRARAGAQPRRLELAPDRARARPPAHRRPARLSPGASARRRGRDLHRGDRRSPDRAADRAHDRRVSARDRARLPPPQRRRPRRGRPVFVQLFHGGREQIATSPKPPAVAPSAVPSLRFKSEPRALTAREIDELIDGYASAARHAADGGLDGVRSRWRTAIFRRSSSRRCRNRRTDRYGLSGADAVCGRGAGGDPRGHRPDGLAVGARLSGDELVPGGLARRRCAEIAGELHGAGLVDFVLAGSRALGYPGRLDLDRPAAAGGAQRDRGSRGGRPPGRAGADPDRHHPRRRPGRRRAAGRRRHLRPRRDDPGADRRSRPDGQGDRAAAPRP